MSDTKDLSETCIKALRDLEKIERIEFDFSFKEARGEVKDFNGEFVIHVRGTDTHQ